MMKKRLLSLALAAVMAGSLTACGGASTPAGGDTSAAGTTAGSAADTSAAADTGAAGDQITMKWAMWDKDIMPYYTPIIEAYEAKNPGVKV